MKKFRLVLISCMVLAACGPSTPSVVEDQESDTSAASPKMAAEDLLPSKEIQLKGPDGKMIQIQAEIADEPAEQQRGLMFRESLPTGFGMLFVFDQEQPLGFWMKNTLIPLDIIYFAADGALVSSTTMVPCEADPCMSYPSEGNAKFALELPAGFMQEEGISADWSLIY